MRRLFLAAALVALSAPGFAHASTWELDQEHSMVGFSVKHLLITNVKGQFDKFSGTVEWDEKDVTKSSIQFTADTKSVNTRNETRDNHLRSQDFFYAEKFPQMTFKSTKVEKASGDHLKVTGDLTIRGVTKPVVLDVEGPSKPVKGPGGNEIAGATATGVINRKDFGLSWSKVVEGTGAVVGDEVKLLLDVEMDKKPENAVKPASGKK